MTKMSIAKLSTATLLIATLSGCAMFNKATVNYSRNTTIGQELGQERAQLGVRCYVARKSTWQLSELHY